MRKYWIGSTFALALTSMSPIALAQDIPPQPVLHGFDDLAFKNYYITPRGLLLTNKGLTIQILNGFAASAYQNANGPVDDIAFVAGVWNDLNPAHQNERNRSVRRSELQPSQGLDSRNPVRGFHQSPR